ncbi:MAG: phosphoserine phosphatase RsbU/P [Actinomycetota bacterium]|jgi:sigma-B regulation protein RsbU (phosphoserine phosphatase)
MSEAAGNIEPIRPDTDEFLLAIRRAEESEARAAALIHALQQTLIPPTPPHVPGLDVAAVYRPAVGEVGGDFYDVFEVADGDWCVVIGDVSGKGTDAAIVTSTARHVVRSSALRHPEPSDLLRVLNAALVEHPTTRFCTVALVRLRSRDGVWVAALTSGGHPFPILTRHGSATKLGKPGSLLGLFHNVEFHDVSIKLAKGDALVLYTDGVVEGRNDADEFYGEDRLQHVLTGPAISAQTMADQAVADVMAFQSSQARDDIALVVIRNP